MLASDWADANGEDYPPHLAQTNPRVDSSKMPAWGESLTHLRLPAWDSSLDGVDVGATEGDHEGAAGEVAEGDPGGEGRDLGAQLRPLASLRVNLFSPQQESCSPNPHRLQPSPRPTTPPLPRSNAC